MKVDFLIAAVAAALVGAAGAESLSFSAETDKDPLSYRVGEEMAFTFTVVDRAAKNAPVKGRRVAWTRTGDDGLARKGISYDAAKGPDAVPVEELTAFGDEIAKEYFRRAREGVRKLDAKLLFLGCGFKGTVPAHVERFSSEFCDCLY